MKGFTKDGKFRPTGNKTKSSLKKTDIGRNKVSLRQDLDRAGSEYGVSSETYAMDLFESTMQGNGEVSCRDIIGSDKFHCDFKITKEEWENKYNHNDEQASGDLWTHAYSHVRPYNKRSKESLSASARVDKTNHKNDMDREIKYLEDEIQFMHDENKRILQNPKRYSLSERNASDIVDKAKDEIRELDEQLEIKKDERKELDNR